jgi:hypothetical protein
MILSVHFILDRLNTMAIKLNEMNQTMEKHFESRITGSHKEEPGIERLLKAEYYEAEDKINKILYRKRMLESKGDKLTKEEDIMLKEYMKTKEEIWMILSRRT